MSKDKPFHKDSSFYVAVGVMISAFAATTTVVNNLCKNCISNIIIPPDEIVCENNKYNNIAEIPNIPKEPVTYSGSTTFAPLGERHRMDQMIVNSYPQFKFKYPRKNDDYGSNTGVNMLLANQLIFSLSSENLSSLPSYERLPDKDKDKLDEYKVASDAIVFYVNKNLQVATADRNWPHSFDLLELKKFLTGEDKSWEAGKFNIPIKVYTRNPANSGTAKFVQRNVMDNNPFFVGKKVGYMKTTSESIQKIADSKQPVVEIRIGYASASEVCNQETVQVVLINNINPCTNEDKYRTKTNQVNTPVLYYSDGNYPEKLKRFLFVIIRKDVPLSKQAGVAYCNILLSGKGKEYIKQEGLIPLK